MGRNGCQFLSFSFSASHLPRTRNKPGPRCRTPVGTVLLLFSVRIFFLLGYPPFPHWDFLPSSASQHSPEVFFIFFTFKIRKGDLYYQTNHMGEDGLSIYIGSLFP